MKRRPLPHRVIQGMLVLLACLPGISLPAAAPQGLHVFDSTHAAISNSPIWDLSGNYTMLEGFLLNRETIFRTIRVPFQWVHDAQGKIHGTGTAQAEIREGPNTVIERFQFQYETTGKVKTSGNLTTAHIKLKASGLDRDFTFHTKGKFTVDTTYHRLIGVNRGRINTAAMFPPRFNRKFYNALGLDLPPNALSPWTLSLDIIPTGPALSGTGRLALSNGAASNFALQGRYHENSDISRIILRGLPGSFDRGLKIQCALSGAYPEFLGPLKGRFFGQTLELKEPDPVGD